MSITLPQVASIAGAATGAWAGTKLLPSHKIIGAVVGGVVIAAIVTALFNAYNSQDSSGRKNVGLPEPTTGSNAVDADAASTVSAALKEAQYVVKQIRDAT
jgi:hypothetical protein